MIKKYDLIYFDADETLYDFSRSQREAFEAMRTHFNVVPNTESSEDEITEFKIQIFDIYQKHNHALWAEFENNLVTQDVLRVARFERFFEDLLRRRMIGEAVAPRNFETVATYFETALGKGTYLLDGAKELCQQLSNHYAMSIITNGLKSVQYPRFENSEIVNLIEHLIVSEETGFQKPQVEIFEYAERLTKFTDKSRILMVGDSLVSDIAGGIAYGIDTCWYNPNGKENDTDYQPTFEIRDLKELLDYV